MIIANVNKTASTVTIDLLTREPTSLVAFFALLLLAGSDEDDEADEADDAGGLELERPRAGAVCVKCFM